MLDLRKYKGEVIKRKFKGDFVYFQKCSIATAKNLENIGNDDDMSIIANLLIECLCDESGNSLGYTEDDIYGIPPDDALELVQMCMDASIPKKNSPKKISTGSRSRKR